MKIKLSLVAAAIALATSIPVVGSSTALARQGTGVKLLHDVNDDHGGLRGGHGADDGANHDANDDHGGRRGGHGADDGASHDANDDHGGRNGGHGADDGAGHDANDNHGGHSGRR